MGAWCATLINWGHKAVCILTIKMRTHIDPGHFIVQLRTHTGRDTWLSNGDTLAQDILSSNCRHILRGRVARHPISESYNLLLAKLTTYTEVNKTLETN